MRKADPTIYPSGKDRCPIRLFKIFRDHRPEDTLVHGFPFFLGINRKKEGKDKVWYTNRPMGRNQLAEILPGAKKLLKLPGKVANHSVQKTGISQLLDADIPEIFVAQHNGMKNTDSLKSYKTASESHQIRMSNVLNDITKEKRKRNNSSVDAGNSGLFPGAIFSNCTFNIGTTVYRSASPSRHIKRFRLLSERNEERST